jgi:hypothetical protein
MLLYTSFQKKPNTVLTLIGMGCLSLIMVFLLIIGILRPNIRIALSTVPFLITGAIVLWNNRRWKPGDMD